MGKSFFFEIKRNGILLRVPGLLQKKEILPYFFPKKKILAAFLAAFKRMALINGRLGQSSMN